MITSHTFHHTSIAGRDYRYSDERRVSGRPALIQYRNAKLGWRVVRNIDNSDAVWLAADALAGEPAQ